MTLGLDIRAAQVVVEGGDALVLLRLLAGHGPQAGTTDHRVLGHARHIRVVGQRRNPGGKFRVALDVAVGGRRPGVHRALARDEGGVRCAAAALVVKQALLREVGQVFNMAHVQGGIERQAGIQAIEAVALGREFDVVPGRETLELRPADPAGGERALVTGGLELGSRQGDFRPGQRRLFRVEAGRLERVLVVVEHRGRAVEREAHHLAIGRGVVTRDCRHVGLRVKLEAGIAHDLGHWHDRALAGHHRGGTDFEHLQNVGRIAGTERSHGRRHRLIVGALEGRHDLEVFLLLVEVLGQPVDPLSQRTAHRVPPLNFSL